MDSTLMIKCLRGIRGIYAFVAAVLVSHGFYHAFQKMRNEDVLTRRETLVFDKMRYPSVTFCYKYQHGTKIVVDKFLPKLYEEAERKGLETYFYIIIMYF